MNAGLARALEGCLLGCAAGDSVGLPFEGLSRASAGRLVRLPLEQSLIFGRGLLSDDTEHTVMVALSLLEAGVDAGLFGRRLAARLRWWLVAAPPGVGGATARSILMLWVGWPICSSGVFSAGNGPAMRSALLGVVFGDQPARLVEFIQASTRLTHTDPRALEAALAVAVAAACAARLGSAAPAAAMSAFAGAYREVSQEPALWAKELELVRLAVDHDLDVGEFARSLGCGRGVTGYALHTVPVALYAWMRHSGDLRQAVTSVVLCGGDTDSAAAIVGAIVGSGMGPEGVPASWLADLLEWPRHVAWMRGTARRLAMAVRCRKPSPPTLASRARDLVWLPWTLVRNLSMFVVVVYVLLRRLAALALHRVRAPR
jgi:ADP-ribosyl-[dinitrogen reductase] hydrolase